MSKLEEQLMIDRAGLLVGWLQILCNGRVKPDDPSKKQNGGSGVAGCCNSTGVIRDSGDFRDLIIEINNELKEILI